MDSPTPLLDLVDSRTADLLAQVRTLDDEAMREPSLLPDWTRGHVLTHLARNADALGNLLTWARTGVETPMYVSRDQRDADIEDGSSRAAGTIFEDLHEASLQWAEGARTLPEGAWGADVRFGRKAASAADVPALRLSEIELHRVDLGIGYDLTDCPPEWVALALPDAARGLDERAGEPVTLVPIDAGTGVGSSGRTITGTGAALLGWLTGRSAGEDLASDGPLPRLGAWR